MILGLAGALWSASGYVGGFMKAANVIYEVEEGRKFWKLKPIQIFATLVVVLLTAIVALAVVVTGPVAENVGDVIGPGDTAVTVFDIVKWPVIALIVSQIFAFLYWITPNVKQPGFKWVSPGGILAVVLWIAASARSRSTSRTSARTRRPTAGWPRRSSSWSGCGSPTS